MRRVVDAVLASVLLALGAPLIGAVAVAVRVRMGSPVLFRQARSGVGGRPFSMVKFRTMVPPTSADEDGPHSDAARLTRLGAFLRATSLDELPTLTNVLRGQMSVVGPRPLPTTYLDRYDDDQARRLEVRPGVTGWAQVNGRNTLSWPDKLEFDRWYVDHRSAALDLRIMVRTIGQVIRRSGIDHGAGVTMTEFRRDER